MSKLIPISQEADLEIKEKLEKRLGLRDIEQFINFYNQGLLAVNNQTIKDFADEISASYSNIDKNRNYMSIMSEEETTVIAIQDLMKEWKFITAIKSLAEQMLAEGYSEEERIIFQEQDYGYPSVVDPQDNTQLKRHWSSRKLADSYQDIVENMFLEDIKEQYDDEGSVVAFKIEDVLLIDDSFILGLKEYIVSSAKESNSKSQLPHA